MISGAVLAGGRSVRFGRNKALELFRGKRLVDWAVESLKTFCDPVMVVANDLSLYFDVKASLVRDIIPQQGPLVGIYTALLFSRHPWVFIKATDMPLLLPGMIELMLNARPDFDAVVPTSEGRPEPLLAVYSRAVLPAVAEAIEMEERRVISFYRKIRVRYVPETEWHQVDPEGLSFRNVNTPHDLESLPWT